MCQGTPARSARWLMYLLLATGSLSLLLAIVGGAVLAVAPELLRMSPRGAPTPASGGAPNTAVAPTIVSAPEPVAPSVPSSVWPLPPAPGEALRAGESRLTLPLRASQAVWGSANAPVTLALFGDLECEATRALLPTLSRVAVELGERVRLAFYNRPLAEHAQAPLAARTVAKVAIERGSDAAFRALWRIAQSAPLRSALEAQLATNRIPTDLDRLANDQQVTEQLAHELRLAVELDVQSTPVLLVNGRRLPPQPSFEQLTQAVADEARAVRWLTLQGVPVAQAYERRVRRNVFGSAHGAEDRECVPLDGAPSIGPHRALLTIVEFGDFECPHCRAFEPTLAAALASYAGNVRRVFRTFIDPSQLQSRRAAAFALAARDLAGEPGFWALHDALLGQIKPDISDERLRATAQQLGLNAQRIGELARQRDVLHRIDRDNRAAAELMLKGTPTVFVNGRQISGAVPKPILDFILKYEYEAARRLVARGVSPQQFEGVLCE